MALRRDLTKHLLHLSAAIPPSTAGFASRRSYLASPDNASRGFFRRFLQRRMINQSSSSTASRLPEFLTLPVGEKLREKLSDMTSIGGDRIRLDGLARPPKRAGVSLTAEDTRRILRAAQLEKVKWRLRSVQETTVPYSDFVQICADACGGSQDQALEFAKLLDETATVIVFGNVVFLRPEQVAKTVESLISQSWAGPNGPIRQEFEEMEGQKAQIDKQAHNQVKTELYGGLGFLMAQTLGFMRLTFWELSWDVMEPICFFLTSMHFAMAYTFFLRTSTEPSFEGFYKQRFRTKQAKLMKLHNFDIEKYERLSKAFNRTNSNANCCCI